MFRGNSPTRVDEKGRLKIPAEFKRAFEEGQRFYVTSIDGKRAQLYPLPEWEKKEEALGKVPASNTARMKFLDATSYYGQMVEMDSQGRLLLPQILRDEARLMNADVVVIGKIGVLEPGILEVVNHDEFRGRMKEDPITREDLDALAAFGV